MAYVGVGMPLLLVTPSIPNPLAGSEDCVQVVLPHPPRKWVLPLCWAVLLFVVGSVKFSLRMGVLEKQDGILGVSSLQVIGVASYPDLPTHTQTQLFQNGFKKAGRSGYEASIRHR